MSYDPDWFRDPPSKMPLGIKITIVVAIAALVIAFVSKPPAVVTHEPLALRYCDGVQQMMEAGLELEAMGATTTQQIHQLWLSDDPHASVEYLHSVCLQFYTDYLAGWDDAI